MSCKTLINYVQVQLLNNNATVPTKAHEEDAGFDLYSSVDISIPAHSRAVINTSIAIAMPNNFAGLIWPRSGLSVKHGIDVLAGVVDSGYRGEILVCLYNTSNDTVEIHTGDRIAQIIFQEVPRVSLSVNATLGSSQRGSNGFGSTGT